MCLIIVKSLFEFLVHGIVVCVSDLLVSFSIILSQVKQVKVTKRLSDSPAIVTDHESGALRRMMKMVVRILLLIIR